MKDNPGSVQEFFAQSFIGENTVRDWCWFAGIMIAGLVLRGLIAWLLTHFIFRFIRRKDSEAVGFERLMHLMRKPWNFLLLLVTLYIAFTQLSYPKAWHLVPETQFGVRMVVWRLFETTVAFALTWLLLRLTDFFGLMMAWRASLTESKSDDQLVPFFKEAIKIILVILSIFMVLGSVYQVNIASLIAGLGIGGLAVALAAKESLENLMGSFTVFLDKPFIVGDHVRVGSVEGTVEKIGFRSTRIRTVENSFVTVPNKKMVEAELDNLSQRTSRRVRFVIGLTYSTKTEQLQKIISEIQHLLDNDSRLDPAANRVRFFDFSASALDIQIVYFIRDINADLYLNVREEINFRVLDIVQRNDAKFAYPSTSVYIERQPENYSGTTTKAE